MVYSRGHIFDTELPIARELKQMFGRYDQMVILDIGGCEGEDSLRYSKLFPNSEIFVFEPLPENQELIRQNIERYNASRVHLVPVALAGSRGITDFYVSSGQPDGLPLTGDWDFGNKSSSLLPPAEVLKQVEWLQFNSVIRVETDTLENFSRVHQLQTIDFVHMDVQGAELGVLRGAGTMLKAIRAIWLEIAEYELYKGQPLRNDIETFMKQQGFQLAMTRMEGKVGDQLYINLRYFKIFNFLGFRKFRCL